MRFAFGRIRPCGQFRPTGSPGPLLNNNGSSGPGSAVYDDKDTIGEVLIASPHPEGTVLLSVLPLAYGEQGEIFLHHPGGIALRLQTLPYPLEEIS